MRDTFPGRLKAIRILCVIGVGALLFGLLMGLASNIASASVNVVGSEAGLAGPASQRQATPTPTSTATSEAATTATSTPQTPATPRGTVASESIPAFDISLAELGYDEIILDSPYDRFQYSFQLPETWAIDTDGILDLDLSYIYIQFSAEEYPTLFGELMVKLDGQTLDILPISAEQLDDYQWPVQLPASMLNDPDRTRHTIELILSAGYLCEIPHRAKLVVHPTSSISLDYSQRPLVLDLARYPRPFHQGAFRPDTVRFVLPSQPTANDLSNAASIAAKLGDLTGLGVVISVTTDLELSNLAGSAPFTLDDHLIVIGQPQDSQFLSLLNDTVDLPVSLHQRQLDLVAQGPLTVAPGETFTYTFAITNTLDRTLNLSVVDQFPPYSELVACSPSCAESGDDNTVTWSDNQLEPDETMDFSLSLRASDVLTGATFENVVTLVEADLGPVNVATLTSTVVAEPSETEASMPVSSKNDYFFVHQGTAVAEGDGIIQEIVSPWSENQAILIVTGLNDAALRKASLAMSSETRFPGMDGPVALVRESLSSPELDTPSPAAVHMTLADLGYSDRLVRGGGALKQADYYFSVPYGWQLTEDAFIEIHFSHSRVIDYENSGLTVLLNGQPIASTALSEETADNGRLHISLADTDVRSESNRLSLEIDAEMPGVCVDHDQAWFLINSRSELYLSHREGKAEFDLDLYPYPFHLNPALSDLLLVLPAAPTVEELGLTLRLAARLGNSAAGRAIAPNVMLTSDPPPQDLGDFQILTIGRPARNSMIQEVNADLPQPFLPGSDEIDQRLDDVVFRLPPGVDLGYLQLITSPWNEARAFLAVTGTTDKAVNWAASVLTDRLWALNGGNLALVREDRVDTIDTRRLTSRGVAMAMATAVPEMLPTATTSPAPIAALTPSTPTLEVSATGQAPRKEGQPAWLIPLIAMTVVIVIASFAIAFWRARQRAW